MAQAKVGAMEAKVKSLEGELQQAAANNNRGATVAGGPTAFTLPGAPHKSVLLKGHTSSVRFVTQLSHGRVCSA
jgi:cation diffusion facilitator CzcD-associated flavoprotein CzcO